MRGVRLVLLLGCVSILMLASVTAGTASASPNAPHGPTLSPQQLRAIRALVGERRSGKHLRGYLIQARARTSIVGGSNADESAWGFMAFVANPSNGFYCSGTLVAPNVVLTAGHCATDETSGQPLSPDSFTVTIGTANVTLPYVPVYFVSQVIVNPHYDGTSYAGDAAILVLSKSAPEQPIALARSGQPGLYAAGKDALIAGWGIDASGDSSGLLQAAPTNVQGVDYCEHYWDGFESVATWDTCAAQTPPNQLTATCNGDSGGPLLTADAGGNAVEIGLTSVGPADCATDRADYFTRTDVISNWVNAVTASLAVGTTSSSTSTSTTRTSMTTTTSTTTTSTTTTNAAVKPPPISIALTLPTLTMSDARSYAATMVHARTHKRPRLALSCTRKNLWEVHCSLRWKSHGSSYAVSGRFFHYLRDKQAFWAYDYTGTRHWTTCRVRHHQRACTAYVQRFRWTS